MERRPGSGCTLSGGCWHGDAGGGLIRGEAFCPWLQYVFGFLWSKNKLIEAVSYEPDPGHWGGLFGFLHGY